MVSLADQSEFCFIPQISLRFLRQVDSFAQAWSEDFQHIGNVFLMGFLSMATQTPSPQVAEARGQTLTRAA